MRRLSDAELPTAFNMRKHLCDSEDGLTINYDGPGDADDDKEGVLYDYSDESISGIHIKLYQPQKRTRSRVSLRQDLSTIPLL